MLQQGNFLLHPPRDVRSNTRNVHPSITPSAALQLKHRLCPPEGIQECEDCTVV